MEDESDADSRTIFCGNLSPKVTEEILYELFLQGGPVERVKIPLNNGRQATYGFVTYKHLCSVEYALEIYRDTELYGSLLNLKKRQVKNQDNNDRETITSRNGNKQDNSLLQGANNMIHMSNMYQNMAPQGLQNTIPQGFQQMYHNNMYYSSQAPQYDHHRRSPQKSRHHNNSSNRNAPQNYNLQHTPSGRYDQDRSNRRYDDYKFRNNDRHDRKRHKR